MAQRGTPVPGDPRELSDFSLKMSDADRKAIMEKGKMLKALTAAAGKQMSEAEKKKLSTMSFTQLKAAVDKIKKKMKPEG